MKDVYGKEVRKYEKEKAKTQHYSMQTNTSDNTFNKAYWKTLNDPFPTWEKNT